MSSEKGITKESDLQGQGKRVHLTFYLHKQKTRKICCTIVIETNEPNWLFIQSNKVIKQHMIAINKTTTNIV